MLYTRDKGESRRALGTCRFRISFIETLKRRVENNRRYIDDSFLSDVEKQIRSSDALSDLPADGELEGLQFISNPIPTLRVHGLLAEVKQRSRLFGDAEMTSLVLSEKMYRIISWLDYHGKFGLESLYELVEYCPNETET